MGTLCLHRCLRFKRLLKPDVEQEEKKHQSVNVDRLWDLILEQRELLVLLMPTSEIADHQKNGSWALRETMQDFCPVLRRMG